MAEKNFKLLCERYTVPQGRKWYFNYTGPKSIKLPFFSEPSTGDIVGKYIVFHSHFSVWKMEVLGAAEPNSTRGSL